MAMSMEQKCRCLVLEERALKDEEKYTELETELQKRNKEFESLELRFKKLESEKLVVDEELRNLKGSKEGSLIEQMMVNGALEFEKQVAEKEAEDWKKKFEKLVEVVRKLDEIGGFRFVELELDENVKLGLELARIKNTESSKVYKVDPLSREGLGYHQSSGEKNICFSLLVKLGLELAFWFICINSFVFRLSGVMCLIMFIVFSCRHTLHDHTS